MIAGAFLTRDQLLADLRRAVQAYFPEDSSERLLREIELRMPDETPVADGARPKLAREHLLESLGRALRACFPDRAEALLEEVRGRISSRDHSSELTVADPKTPQAPTWSLEDVDAEAYPSLVVVAPTASRYFAMRFPLHRSNMVLGRSSDCDLFLWEDSISRRHLELVLDEDRRVTVQDLGSTNGLVVNDRKVKTASLHDGDHIRCGRLVMRFVAPSA